MRTEPCLCGAPDCKRCHPENYEHGVYVAEMTEEERENLEYEMDQYYEER